MILECSPHTPCPQICGRTSPFLHHSPHPQSGSRTLGCLGHDPHPQSSGRTLGCSHHSLHPQNGSVTLACGPHPLHHPLSQRRGLLKSGAHPKCVVSFKLIPFYMHLTLVHGAWIWGELPPSEQSSEDEYQPNRVGGIEGMHEPVS